MGPRLDVSPESVEACAKILMLLAPLTPRDRARVLLLTILDCGPGVASDEALLSLCHAAQREVPPPPAPPPQDMTDDELGDADYAIASEWAKRSKPQESDVDPGVVLEWAKRGKR